jgi:NAD(P)-dependent dehydrogenase (short-subunit alcohol dehydrogenase family)
MERVVIVTGAAQGIGLEIVRRFLIEGEKIGFNDCNQESIRIGVKKLPQGYDDNLLTCLADITDRGQVVNMIDSVLKKWGRIDIVVNNAGIYPNHRFLQMSEENWDRVMDVNAKGIFLVSQAAAQKMISHRIQGHIINISSGSYHIAREGCAHYCASKAAGVMLTKVMAMELASYGIQVNAVAPGLIKVESLDLSPDYLQETLRQIPSGRLGSPEDVAEIVFQLANMNTDYITGAVIAVDGGLALGRYGIPHS